MLKAAESDGASRSGMQDLLIEQYQDEEDGQLLLPLKQIPGSDPRMDRYEDLLEAECALNGEEVAE